MRRVVVAFWSVRGQLKKVSRALLLLLLLLLAWRLAAGLGANLPAPDSVGKETARAGLGCGGGGCFEAAARGAGRRRPACDNCGPRWQPLRRRLSGP